MRAHVWKLAILAGMAWIVAGVWSVNAPAGCVALGVALLVIGIGSS